MGKFDSERARAFQRCRIPSDSYISDKLGCYERSYIVVRKKVPSNPFRDREIQFVREYDNGAVVVEYIVPGGENDEWPYRSMDAFLRDHGLRRSEVHLHLGVSIHWLLFDLGLDEDLIVWESDALVERCPRLERMTTRAIRELAVRLPRVPRTWREKVDKAEDELFNALMRTNYKACVRALAKINKIGNTLWVTEAIPATPKVLTPDECVAVAREFSEIVYRTLSRRPLRVEIDPANGMERKGVGIITAKRPRIHSHGGLTPEEIETITPLLRDAWVERPGPRAHRPTTFAGKIEELKSLMTRWVARGSSPSPRPARAAMLRGPWRPGR